MSDETPLKLGTLPLPKKTPQETREVQNIMIKFTDGTTKVVVVHGEDSSGFYRETKMVSEHKEILIQEVFIANGLTR